MPFRMRLKVYTPWCLLLLLSCSTSPHNSLSIFNATGEYIVRLNEGEEITGIKKSGDGTWTAEELEQIFTNVKIMGKTSATETLLISDPGYLDVAKSNCGDDCAKGQSWIYDEKENTLVQVRKVENDNYTDNPTDIELANSSYFIKAYRSKKPDEDDDAYKEYKEGSRYYWVGKDKEDSIYWVQSNRRSRASREIPTDHQCSNDKKKSNKEIAVKYSIRVKEENTEGYWKRRNINECLYDAKRKPKILYLNADSLIAYTANSVIYFNDDYPKGMLIPPSADDEGDKNEFITSFFDDADGIQAGLGERDSFWVKKSQEALMFHKSNDEDEEHIIFNYTKFELNVTADKMAMWVDRQQDGDADSKVLIGNSKIIYIEGSKLMAADVRLISKVYSKDEDSEGEEDEEEG